MEYLYILEESTTESWLTIWHPREIADEVDDVSVGKLVIAWQCGVIPPIPPVYEY